MHRTRVAKGRCAVVAAALSALATLAVGRAQASDPSTAVRFREQIQPILVDNCYACHGDGAKKGNVSLDAVSADEALLGNRELWFAVLRNVRAGLMPPQGKPRPAAEERSLLEDWIKRGPLGIDPTDPDPGRVTLRRLNRVEYRNTIRDLMGIDFRADEEFPPDDTGYGFDNIGDVLSVSPLLLEKYMQAAEAIVAEAVPTVERVVTSRTVPGADFRGPDDANGARLSVYNAANVSQVVNASFEGTYRLTLELSTKGDFTFDPGRCRLTFKADDHELLSQEFGWGDGKKVSFEFTQRWPIGERLLSFDLVPLTPPEQKQKGVELRIASVRIDGPLEPEHWDRPPNFARFFSKDAPTADAERRAYAREVLGRFAFKAFRRPLDERVLGRLVAIAEAGYQTPGKSFEAGVARAMVAVLSSPRFLFRVEQNETAGATRTSAPVDEHALASRLSYFLWSTMPDDELISLAISHELRQNLSAQVKRMLADPRSEMLVQNFVGQWLQARDVEGIDIEPRTVLARDDGIEKELERQRAELRAFLAEREAARKAGKAPQAPGQGQSQAQRQDFRRKFATLFAKPRVDLDGPLRLSMRRETEMFFSAVVHEDRSVLDLIDCDFTFLNEKLAKHYGIQGVTGPEMRKVTLPENSPRGGVLTQGTVLVVTSNPTRTSPVKRGLFVLDNILGTPPPPPPADIPQLEEAEKTFSDREPTLREVLELHRNKPLCSSCHSRMDPLGLALEDFNAMGMWRAKERNQPLDTAGKLITGEPFGGIRALKTILKSERRADFYRCLTEKLLTYALGRGLESYDVEAVDRIVGRLERENGKFSALLLGIIESAPFQRRRNVPAATATASAAGRSGPNDRTTQSP